MTYSKTKLNKKQWLLLSDLWLGCRVTAKQVACRTALARI